LFLTEFGVAVICIIFYLAGDIVGLHLTASQSQCLSSGIVVRVANVYISVAFEQSEELSSIADDSQYYLLKLANEVTYKRLRR